MIDITDVKGGKWPTLHFEIEAYPLKDTDKTLKFIQHLHNINNNNTNNSCAEEEDDDEEEEELTFEQKLNYAKAGSNVPEVDEAWRLALRMCWLTQTIHFIKQD